MAVSPTTLPIPAVDDRKLYELRATRHALPTLAIAKEMELFERLEKGPKTIEKIAEELQLTPRAAEAMTIVVTALGFLARYNDEQYGLTDLARTYLLPTSPFYYHELMQEDDPSVEQLRRVFRSDDQPIQPIAVKMRDLTDKQVENFINRMHTITLPAARGLADQEVLAPWINFLMLEVVQDHFAWALPTIIQKYSVQSWILKESAKFPKEILANINW